MKVNLKDVVPLSLMSFNPPMIPWNSAKHSVSIVEEDETLREQADLFQKTWDFETESHISFVPLNGTPVLANKLFNSQKSWS